MLDYEEIIKYAKLKTIYERKVNFNLKNTCKRMTLVLLKLKRNKDEDKVKCHLSINLF